MKKADIKKAIDWGLISKLDGSVQELNMSINRLEGRMDSANASLLEIAKFSANANKLSEDSSKIATESVRLGRLVMALTGMLFAFALADFLTKYQDIESNIALTVSFAVTIGLVYVFVKGYLDRG